MRGNEFERRVQEEMESLHLRPSATVWEEVEKELKRKKRRRVVFYLSMLAGLGLLGYMSFNFFAPKNTELASQNKEQQLQTDKSSANSPDNSINQSSVGQQQSTSTLKDNTNTTTIGSSIYDKSNTDNSSVANTEQKINQSIGQQPAQPVRQFASQPTLSQSTTPSTINSNGQLVVRQKNPSIGRLNPDKTKPQQQTPIEDKPVADIDNSITNTTGIATKNPQTDTQIPSVDSVKKDSAIAKIDLRTDLPSTEKQDIAIAKTKKPTKLKIKIGFDGSVGKNYSRNNSFKVPSNSYIQESFSPVLSGYYTFASNNSPTPPQGATNGGYGGSLGAGFVRPPSPITAGLAFKAGMSVEIQISKRNSIVAGMRYAYLSESLDVGQHGFTNNLVVNRWQGPFDALQNYPLNTGGSTANPNPLALAPTQYYTGGYYYGPYSEKYTNKYHFLELPVSYQREVINGRKIQLLWNAGVTTSVLLGTNALVYDTAAYGVYYKNNRAFNSVHFALHSGLSLRFGRENKLQWSIGPEFSMDMTHVLKSDFILRNRYFMYGGVTARVLLPGKK